MTTPRPALSAVSADATRLQSELDATNAEIARLEAELPRLQTAERDANDAHYRAYNQHMQRVGNLDEDDAEKAARNAPAVREASKTATVAAQAREDCELRLSELRDSLTGPTRELLRLRGGKPADFADLDKRIKAAEVEAARLFSLAEEHATRGEADEAQDPDLLTDTQRAEILAKVALGEIAQSDADTIMKRHIAATERASKKTEQRAANHLTVKGIRSKAESAAEVAKQLRNDRNQGLTWYLLAEVEDAAIKYRKAAESAFQAWAVLAGLAGALERRGNGTGRQLGLSYASSINLPTLALPVLDGLPATESPDFRRDATDAAMARLSKDGLV